MQNAPSELSVSETSATPTVSDTPVNSIAPIIISTQPTSLTLPPEKDREGLNMEKINHFIDVMFGKRTAETDAFLESFTAFDVRLLRDLTGKRISSVLLDIDGCIAPPYGPILDANLGHIDNLKRAGVNFGVYSNCKSMDRLNPLREMDIPIYCGNWAKPTASGFIESCHQMQFDPFRTWMIDDNPLTGGGAIGVLEGMAFVKPIPVDQKHVPLWTKRAKLRLSNLLRDLAIQRTLRASPKIIRLGAK